MCDGGKKRPRQLTVCIDNTSRIVYSMKRYLTPQASKCGNTLTVRIPYGLHVYSSIWVHTMRSCYISWSLERGIHLAENWTQPCTTPVSNTYKFYLLNLFDSKRNISKDWLLPHDGWYVDLLKGILESSSFVRQPPALWYRGDESVFKAHIYS